MTEKFQAVKGTRDFYPKDWAFLNWLFGKMREVSQRFGYQEYEGPILESFDLFAAKSGEELVKEQTFTLKDRKGEKLVLRPELTPVLARMVAQKRYELPIPIRWFSIGRRFRYEQPQKGRMREFFQWDVDLLGWDSAEADAEIIAIGAEFFKSLGLTPKEIVIKVNNRRLMDFKLSLIEVKKTDVSKVFRAIDKRDKMKKGEWKNYLKDLGLSELQIQDLEGILADYDFALESEELTACFETLKELGIEDFVEFDPTIVRGLDYYTGTVFEARDREGEFRAILGGGRYDNLVEVVGGPKFPGVGFAAGDVVLKLVLEKFGKIPELLPCPTKVLITIFDESFVADSIKLAQKLREKGINTEIYLDYSAKLDKQLRYADRVGIPYSIILGPQEIAANKVALKNMKTGEQELLSQNVIAQFIARHFQNAN